jgi:hypothetical protein
MMNITNRLGGVERWYKVIEKAVAPFKLVQPHKGFNPKRRASSRASASARSVAAGVDVKRT